MGMRKRRSHRSGRAPLPSPGRPPTNDIAGEHIDDEGNLDEPRPCRHIGKIRDPYPVRSRGLELPVDPIERTRRFLSLIVVRAGLPRMTPFRPKSRISRSIVQRATAKPSRRICRQTLRTP